MEKRQSGNPDESTLLRSNYESLQEVMSVRPPVRPSVFAELAIHILGGESLGQHTSRSSVLTKLLATLIVCVCVVCL